jgi:hypothetical protein
MNSKQFIYIQGIKTAGCRHNLATEKKDWWNRNACLIAACYSLALAGYDSLDTAQINDQTQTLEQFS